MLSGTFHVYIKCMIFTSKCMRSFVDMAVSKNMCVSTLPSFLVWFWNLRDGKHEIDLLWPNNIWCPLCMWWFQNIIKKLIGSDNYCVPIALWSCNYLSLQSEDFHINARPVNVGKSLSTSNFYLDVGEEYQIHELHILFILSMIVRFVTEMVS
jgi:hypothetical protein